MTEPMDRTTVPLIGRLVLEQSDLEKQIGALRDDFARRARVFAQVGRLLVLKPERLVFDGQTVSEQFAGESTVDRKAMDVDSLIEELRAAIIRESEITEELRGLGIDPEEVEQQNNLRASRAVWNPASLPDPRDGNSPAKPEVGFRGPRKKGAS